MYAKVRIVLTPTPFWLIFLFSADSEAVGGLSKGKTTIWMCFDAANSMEIDSFEVLSEGIVDGHRSVQPSTIPLVQV